MWRNAWRSAVDVEWGQSLIRGWNAHGWFDMPRTLGDRIGKLIGAPPGTVIAADSTSINLAKVLTAALELRPERRVVLSDTGNFPSDLYVAQGVIRALGGRNELRIAAPEAVESAIDDDLAVLMLTEVDYRTGRRHDMKRLIARAHEAGALAIWDLCHSAGAFPVDLSDGNADFAVGCGYKYLNGGPGAPAFVYVRPELQEKVMPSLAGWMGHASPFAFDLDYRPAKGIDRLRAGTPGVLSMIALDSALDVWEGVDMRMVRDKSVRLAELFISEVEARCSSHGLSLASPRPAEMRGSQVSFHCEEGYAVMQALIAQARHRRLPCTRHHPLRPHAALYRLRRGVGRRPYSRACPRRSSVGSRRLQKEGSGHMSNEPFDPKKDGALTDFASRMSYGDYLQLEKILNAQAPLSKAHDELLFIIQHQTSELWMKLAIHELSAATSAIAGDDLQPAFKMLARVARIMEQLNSAWDVLRTMTPSEYTHFRSSLGQSSGLQSYQYRAIEYLAGNKNVAMLKPHEHRKELFDWLDAIRRRPSIYDEAIAILKRRGFSIEPAVLERDKAEPYQRNESVKTAWMQVYRDPRSIGSSMSSPRSWSISRTISAAGASTM